MVAITQRPASLTSLIDLPVEYPLCLLYSELKLVLSKLTFVGEGV